MDAEKLWKILFIAAVSLARMGQGMYLSIPGPTLLYLTELYSVDVSQIAFMFTLRAVGMMMGAAAYSFTVYKFKSFNPLSATGPCTLLIGIMTTLTPWCSGFVGFLASYFVSGFVFSYSDGAMQTLYLRIWDEDSVGPFIQSFHFGISLGSLIAPLIATPFLEEADQAGNSDPDCITSSIETTVLPTSLIDLYGNGSSTIRFEAEYVNPVAWSYVIVGLFSVLVSLPLFYFWAVGLGGRIKMRGQDRLGGKYEEPIKDVWPVILPLAAYYFLSVALEATYANYIYAVAYCMGIGFTVTQAGRLNFMYYVGYTVSRFTAIVYSKYIKPRTIIACGILLIVAAMAAMCIFGQNIPLVIWISTFFFGLSVATFYPTGVTWASRVTDVSGKYMFVFLFSAGLDSMITMPVAGVIFETSPFYVMYLIAATAIGNGIVFIGMEIAARRHLKSHDEKALSLQRNRDPTTF